MRQTYRVVNCVCFPLFPFHRVLVIAGISTPGVLRIGGFKILGVLVIDVKDVLGFVSIAGVSTLGVPRIGGFNILFDCTSILGVRRIDGTGIREVAVTGNFLSV